MTNITPIHHMTKDEYQKQRQQIRAQVGDVNREATAIRDQALAKLFVHSGWTQQELAEAEGKTRPWVTYQLRFGRFLIFITSGNNSEKLPNGFRERRFRSYWERTKGTNEYQRFTHVLRLWKRGSNPSAVTIWKESMAMRSLPSRPSLQPCAAACSTWRSV